LVRVAYQACPLLITVFVPFGGETALTWIPKTGIWLVASLKWAAYHDVGAQVVWSSTETPIPSHALACIHLY
jgi:hypothetical protein